jgi:hypothetical protein
VNQGQARLEVAADLAGLLLADATIVLAIFLGQVLASHPTYMPLSFIYL